MKSSKLCSENTVRPSRKWTHYFQLYDRHFSKFIDKPVVVLEIGVCDGGSLQMWKEFFGSKSKIIGIDVNSETYFEEPQIHIHIGNQADTEFLSFLVDKYGPPDVLIDDGSHIQSHLNATFQFLYPLMRSGSIYFIEDTHTSYLDEYGGGLLRNDTIVETTKKLVDELTGRHFGTITDITLNTNGIHFYDSVIVFEKNCSEKLKIFL